MKYKEEARETMEVFVDCYQCHILVENMTHNYLGFFFLFFSLFCFVLGGNGTMPSWLETMFRLVLFHQKYFSKQTISTLKIFNL